VKEAAAPSALGEWQRRLGEHFTALHTARKAIGKPVFALEHGLENDEFERLAAAIRNHIKRAEPVNEHAWAWVVYAAEVGYGYSGDEYWHTFAQDTPGWREHGSRRWIRARFVDFHKRFGGARPQGPWAQHFSIIAWPILHAILPRDLQQQLARVLFDVRHSFSPEVFASPTALGELIAERSWYASSRFQNLVQETDLIGLVASALLFDEDRQSSIILPSTLKRLRTDLEREQSARQWLRDARRMATERLRLRGLSVGVAKTSGAIPRPRVEELTNGKPIESPPRLEPRLILRPKDLERKQWEAVLEIPDLSTLAARFPTFRELIVGARCTVAGSNGRPRARGWLLQGAQRVTLEQWPRPDETLLAFEGASADARVLLRTHLGIRPGPWLFRIASDGLAYEVKGNAVRSDERYVMVSASTRPEFPGHSRPVSITAQGVLAALLEMPGAFTTDEEQSLRSLGLSRTRNVRVAPAGLAATGWDGEGRAEWLVGESPCMSLLADHTLEGVNISTSAAVATLQIGRLEAGKPIFIGLDPLPVGEHQLRVRAQRMGVAEICGVLNINIRAPRSYEGVGNARGAFGVQLDPLTPSFEQVWSGRASIEIIGPAGRQVTATVRMFDSPDGAAVVTKSLPALELPVAPGRWRSHFQKHFCDSSEAKRRHERARTCEIELRAEELGAVTLRCEREFAPLRWIVDASNEQLSLSIVDDTGLDDETPLVGHFYPFAKPDAMHPVGAVGMTRKSLKVDAPGGLFVAMRGDLYTGIVVSPPSRSLSARRFNAHVTSPTRSVDSVKTALARIELWAHARLAGDVFVGTCQREALRALTRQLVGIIAGDRWALAEHAFTSGSTYAHDLKRLVPTHSGENGFAAAVDAAIHPMLTASARERAHRFGAIVDRFFGEPTTRNVSPSKSGVTLIRRNSAGREEWLAELALRLASAPADVARWAGEELEAGLKRLYDKPTIVRAARYLVVATSKQLGDSTLVSGDLCAGWSWI